MRRCATLVLAVVLFLFPALAVPTPANTWIRTTVTLTVDGLQRSYLVARPSRITAASLPVVVELHGSGATPAYELDRSGFEQAADQAILVFPAGYDAYWNAGACCGGIETDDVAFVSAVVAQVLASYSSADPSRVYLAGYSNGGRMAYRVACDAPGLFTAVAIFGASSAYNCSSLSPTRLLIVYGSLDPDLFVTELNGFIEQPLTTSAAAYATANGCQGSPLVTTVPAASAPSAASTLTLAAYSTPLASADDPPYPGPGQPDAASLSRTVTTWKACSTGKEVQLMTYEGADHAWPTDMATVMWRFFTA